MSDNLEITVTQEQGSVPVTVFKIKGQLDTSNYTLLETMGNEAYENGTRKLLLDFSEATFISSAGLRSIHALYNKLQGDEGGAESASLSKHLKLVNVPDKIAGVIKATGFDIFLEIGTDYKTMVDSF